MRKKCAAAPPAAAAAVRTATGQKKGRASAAPAPPASARLRPLISGTHRQMKKKRRRAPAVPEAPPVANPLTPPDRKGLVRRKRPLAGPALMKTTKRPQLT